MRFSPLPPLLTPEFVGSYQTTVSRRGGAGAEESKADQRISLKPRGQGKGPPLRAVWPVRPARLRFPSATWLALKPERLTLNDLADYLNGSTDEQAAEALCNIELLRQFKKVEQLPNDKKAIVKALIDAFLLK